MVKARKAAAMGKSEKLSNVMRGRLALSTNKAARSPMKIENQ